MPKVKVFDMSGKEVSEMSISDDIFGIEPNKHAIHQYVVSYLANQRQGTQSALTRAEVRGGGKKPWRQKGTGRARQGSIRAPQWYHGGVVFAPKPRDYRTSLNKKVKRLALKSALSSKVVENNFIVVDDIKVDDFRTKTIIEMLNALNANKKSLIVMPSTDLKLVKSANNIQGVKTSLVNTLNAYDILNYDTFVVTKSAISMIEEVYSK